MANRGITPTKAEMTKLTDVAMSQGKSLDQFIEASLDAMTGEYERLKEFGIRASKDGDKVTFMFKNQKTVVQNNEEAIKAYLLSLGDLPGVAGASAAVMETLEGKVSNLGDSWDRFLNNMGKSSQGVFNSVLGYLGWLVDQWATAFQSMDQIRAEVMDKQNASNMTNALMEINSMTQSLVKNGMAQKEAEAKAVELYRKSINISLKAANEDLKTATSANKKKLEDRIASLSSELNAVDIHYKKLKEIETNKNKLSDDELKKAKELRDKQLEYIHEIIVENDSAEGKENLRYDESLKKAGLYHIGNRKLTTDEQKALQLLEKEHNDKMNEIKDKANAEKIKKQEETSKAIQSLVNDEYQYIIDIIDEADITETEKRNAQYEEKKLALLQQNAEGILSEKDLTEQLSEIENQYNQNSLVNQLTTLQAKQLASENYGKSSIQIEKQLADTQMKLATNKANYQIKESKRSKDAETKDLQEKAQVAQNFITQMSASIEQAVENNEDVFAAAGRTFILLLLDVLKSQAELAIAGVTIQSLAQPDSIATFGVSGLVRAAILVGLIEAAFATVKGLVSKGMKSSGKKEGGYTSQGSDDDVTDFVHANEFVANADAVRNPTVKPILDVINLAQRSGTIKGINLPAVVAAQSVGRGFASGGYTSDQDKVIISSPQNTTTNTNDQLMQVIASNAAIMQKVHDRLGEPLYIAIDRFERDMKRRDDLKNSILKT